MIVLEISKSSKNKKEVIFDLLSNMYHPIKLEPCQSHREKNLTPVGFKKNSLAKSV